MSMSFPFKTGRGTLPTMRRMPTRLPSSCPVHASAPSRPASPAPQDAWPPGPAPGLTGWGLLRHMSRDLLGALAGWKQAHGDIVHLAIWPEHQVIVSDPELARELLVAHHADLVRWERAMHVFSGLQGRSVLIVEGEAWHGKRTALQPAFAPRPVQSLVPTIVAACDKALAQWPTRAPAWPVESALTGLAMDIIMQTLFSSGIGDDARLAEHAVHAALVAADKEFYWPASWPDWMPWKRRKRNAVAALRALVERHLLARLRLPQDAWPDDLLTRLLGLHRQDAIAWPLQAVRDECMTAFLAGHETSAATLAWWAWCMAANPAAQATARAEVERVLQGRAPGADTLPGLTYLTQTIKETLRLYPTAPVLISRRSKRALTLGPWTFPERTLFMLPVQLMHHDARWFDEPLAFRPERFAAGAPDFPRGAYLPFGAGPRVCLGQHLAMAELTVVAAMVLQRFSLSLPPDAEQLDTVLHITLRPAQPMRLGIAPAAATAPAAAARPTVRG